MDTTIGIGLVDDCVDGGGATTEPELLLVGGARDELWSDRLPVGGTRADLVRVRDDDPWRLAMVASSGMSAAE